MVFNPADLYRLKREGKKAILLGIENGYAIGKDLRNVERFRRRGVVYMTLCHNGNNDICGSARYNDETELLQEAQAIFPRTQLAQENLCIEL